jgi:hypothetical protein
MSSALLNQWTRSVDYDQTYTSSGHTEAPI